MDSRRLRWTWGLAFASVLALPACDSDAGAGDTDTDSDGGESSTGGDGADPTGSPSGGDASAGSNSGSTDPGTTTGDADTTTGDSASRGDDATTDGDADGGLPDGTGCCDAHAGPGCDEPEPQQCVCEASPDCCVFDWSEACADIAQSRCGATCESEDTTAGETEDDTGPVDAACDRVEVIELDATSADLSGNWVESTSMVGEGQIAVLEGGTAGEVSFDIDVPCDDQWFIWVRYFEQGSDDSYYATVDGEPNPAGVFEGDCTQGGQGYGWRPLNYRTEDDPLCEYVEDPWAPEWDTGAHNVTFSYRESVALARIVVTNDPDYTP
ncbi:MAG: hypothetical protein AAGA54_18215 [Myxococcota bacterium]